MKIETTLAQISAGIPRLIELDTLRFKGSYHASKLQTSCEAENKIFEAHRLKLCKQYGTANAGNTGFTFPKENQEAFAADYETLCATKVSFDLTKLKMEDLESAIFLDKEGVVHKNCVSTGVFRELAWAIE